MRSGKFQPPTQILLLRVLQDHRFERVGGEETLEVDVRVIAATNKTLIDEMKKGTFREDLYYRLNVIPIFIPALRKERTMFLYWLLTSYKKSDRKRERKSQGFRPK